MGMSNEARAWERGEASGRNFSMSSSCSRVMRLRKYLQVDQQEQSTQKGRLTLDRDHQ